ncbi:MAG: hypothetical protein HC866_21440 [Leptolyngbyaceae cyanobacterium RU_5_1]|nr:hypothetical protein [Leptolyngbyaceae cyanobacterium RU_5_1]
MNEFLDPLLRNLNDCDCCEGISQETPVRVMNRAGLSAIAYRVGIHSQFKQSLLAALSDSKLPALQRLTTREDEDFAIALLDVWATVADVLTFYQERIANQSYLRTATERLSLLELARLIGYELRPGVAASTYLVFTLEDALGAPRYATIQAGTKVQSIPGPEEQAQTFETMAAFAARAEWNAIQPRLTEPDLLKTSSTIVYLQGTTLGLKPGDGLLFIGSERETNPTSERWAFRRLKTVVVDQAAGYTIVTWSQGLGSVFSPAQPSVQPKIYVLRQRASLFGHNAPDWRSLPNQTRAGFLPSGPGNYVNRDREWFNFSLSGDTPGLYGEYYRGTNFGTLLMTRTDPTINFAWQDQSPDPLVPVDNFSVRWTGRITPDYSEAYTFYTLSDDGVRLWVNDQQIVNNWTDTITLTAGQKYSIKLEYYEQEVSATIKLFWSSPRQPYEIIPQSRLSTPPSGPFPSETIDLDAVYPQIVPTSWVVLARPGAAEVYQVTAVSEAARTDFNLSSKTSRLTLQGENLYSRFNQHVRDTVVLAQSEELRLAERPLTSAIAGSPSQFLNRVAGTLTPVEGNQIQLKQPIPGLEVGQLLIVQGRRSRARVAATVAANALKLVSPDGSESVGLTPGESLQTLKSPSRTPTGTVQWQLKTQKGFAGTVTANLNQIWLDASQAEDEMVSEVVAIARSLKTKKHCTWPPG